MKCKEIFYMEINTAYRKGKSLIKNQTWCVSTYTTPSDIVRYDKKTMNMLYQKYYSTSYKKKKSVVILDIVSKKQIGISNEIY